MLDNFRHYEHKLVLSSPNIWRHLRQPINLGILYKRCANQMIRYISLILSSHAMATTLNIQGMLQQTYPVSHPDLHQRRFHFNAHVFTLRYDPDPHIAQGVRSILQLLSTLLKTSSNTFSSSATLQMQHQRLHQRPSPRLLWGRFKHRLLAPCIKWFLLNWYIKIFWEGLFCAPASKDADEVRWDM